MVSPFSTRRFRCAGVALLVFWIAGCAGGDDPTTGPDWSESPIGEFAQVIGAVQHEYLDANASVFRSLDVLAPYLESVLSTSPGRISATSELQLPCVSSELAGRTFVFDGSSYVPGDRGGDADGAPVTGVRFLLYSVNDKRTPDLESPLGYLEIQCQAGSSGVELQVNVVAGGVPVLAVTASGSYPDPIDLRLSGLAQTPDGASGWSWGGGLVGGGFFYTAQFPGDVSALYTVLDQPGTAPDNVLVQIRKATPELDWEVYADILAGAGGEILEGPVRLTTPEGSRLAACMSASIELPALASPETGQCGSFALPTISPSEDELRALQSGYVVLRNLYITAVHLVATGLSAAGTSP